MHFADQLSGKVKDPAAKADCADAVLPGSALKTNLSAALDPAASVADLKAVGVHALQFFPPQLHVQIPTEGHFGYRDAINWKTNTVEKHYLTPSQGMGFLAIANTLNQGVVWKNFAKDPVVQNGLQLVLKEDAVAAKSLLESADRCFCELQKR